MIIVDVLMENKYVMAKCLNYMQLKYVYSGTLMRQTE